MTQMEQLKRTFLKDLEGVSTLQGLEDLRIKALGKKGDLTLLMKDIGQKTPEERRTLGAELNTLKDVLTTALEERKEILEEDSLKERLASETLDVTLPPRPRTTGNIHPLSHVMDQAIHIFGQMGFVVAEGPDIEEDFYNFTALNFPPDHPARQEQDTFYLPSSTTGQPLVLRTHTSPVQIRTMLKTQPPIRIIAPGRTYRSDYDATHTPMFHQIEGLVIDKHTHMGHLKGCLEEFCRLFFEDPSLKLRFRPGYFPFTEPSAEVDILWKGSSWLEILGCGMVHPNVLRNCDIDPKEYQGFAFGMGLERIAMLKYGIEDLRLFFESDLRWLNHYGFAPEARE
ncbi:phenylalanine--tRNA ligase subunit alpha [Geitlerinema splendidum]|jgi:phenylalanyl-tRNA synthetase alpha chain|nr:phenylalanine--tRNA ligase subunit alpha [Geitlerinema splendidum]